MKHIGHVDGAMESPLSWRTHSLGMLSPHDLFIPTPGERENIDADRYRHIGWVNPEADGGTIWAAHANASEYGPARPAYVVRVDAVAQPQPVFQDGPHVSNAGPTVVYNGFKTDPMDVLRSEFEALQKDVAALAKIIVDLTRQPPAEQPMTFYDHAFLYAWSSLSMAGYSDEVRATRAHELASVTLRYRQPKQ